jgi:cytosine/uracil/thiamine/allantoin permease
VLYKYAWFVGFFVSALVYYGLMKREKATALSQTREEAMT